MMKTVRKLLGMEKFEIPVDSVEFAHIRRVMDTYVTEGWGMGKTPENPAIVVQFNCETAPPFLEQHLKDVADYFGFEIEVDCDSINHNNMSHADSINRR